VGVGGRGRGLGGGSGQESIDVVFDVEAEVAEGGSGRLVLWNKHLNYKLELYYYC
jgi:hypothetical protein